MKVIISEKPSVAKNIADALSIKTRKDGYLEGGDYIVTWAFGHLLQLYDAKDYDEKYSYWKMENFPIIPDSFEYKIKSSSKNRNSTDSGAKAQLKLIKSLIARKDVTGVVHACDNDREGQIIGDLIIQYTGTKKPVERLLLNEWTPVEVVNGLNKLKPNSELANMSDAGISRQWADWTIGINLTSVATLKYRRTGKKVYNIGRVLLPTLKIIYNRDKEIESFVKSEYFKLAVDFQTSSKETYTGIYNKDKLDKFDKKADLKDVEKSVKGKQGDIVSKESVMKKDYAPYLFNLSGLQGHVTNKHKGWTSDKVLKVAQSLYEKKFTTYPRTASVVLEESLVGKAENVLNVLKKGLPYESEIKFHKSTRVFNNKKVDGHSAIIPTYMIPTGLSKDEEIVYKEIKDRFIMQFMPVSEYEETTIETVVEGHQFITKGKIVTVEGWKKVQKVESKETILPAVKQGEKVAVESTKLTSHQTTPPKPHTEQTLLKVMETCGKSYEEEDSDEMMSAILSGFSIGTPATRADTIKKLKTAEYIESNGKNLKATELGKTMVESFPVEELFDLEYTGRLEKTLSDIEKGKVSKEDFLDLIYIFVRKSVEKINKDGGIKVSINQNEDSLGYCPECGQPVEENQKAFGCSNWRGGCKFSVWKDDKFLASMKKKPTKEMVRTLLKDGSVLVTGLVSKNNNKFDAILSYKKNPETGYYSWDMQFPERKEKKD